MAATEVTVTGTFRNEDGTAASGTLQFQLSSAIANSDVVVSPVPVTVTLNALGSFSLPLAANDDAATTPAGTSYTVLERITSSSNREYSIVVPSAAPGGTVDLSTLMPGSPGFG
jgi:hypothetical protein